MTDKSWKREILEIVAAVAVAWLFYQGLSYAAGTPMPIVSVVSESMEPVLHRGDLLLVTNTSYEIGDIVIYMPTREQARLMMLEPGSTVVHRIVQKKEGGFVTKGDNNSAPDPGGLRTKEQMLGKIQFAAPLLGYPRLALQLFGI